MAEQKLNILHIDSEKYWRGGQQQVFYLHKGLHEKGIKSTLICNKSSELKKRSQSEGLPFAEVSMMGEIDIFAAFKISSICRKSEINVIHAHSSHALSIALFTKLFYPDVSLVGSRRVDFSIRNSFLSHTKYNNKKVNYIICISEYIKKILINDGIDEEKLITIRSGVDINKYNNVIPLPDFRKKLNINSDDFLIGTVAAFAGHKDYPNLLKAFKIVLQKKNNVKLCIVGDGPLRNEIEKMISRLNLNNNIILTGFVNNVGEYLKSFDLFVLASRKEGLGTSIIDALSVGLPIISTRTGGIPELIVDGVNGKLVEPKDHKMLASTIIDMIDNERMRKEFSTSALKGVNKFSIVNTIEHHISLYSNIT